MLLETVSSLVSGIESVIYGTDRVRKKPASDRCWMSVAGWRGWCTGCQQGRPVDRVENSGLIRPRLSRSVGGSGLSPQLNELRKFSIWVLKAASCFRLFSTFRIEWITVEWCLPPKLFPIWGNEALVRDLHRYIAI